jgi:predicted Rossmann fold nucleotide-binding protein DprA/Smf involved in DNA uptake
MSHDALSADTEAVLLLCGRFGGEKQEPYQPLSTREYGELAKWLNAQTLRPGDMLSIGGQEGLKGVVEAKLEPKRIEFLLGRGTALALALERWARGGIWVIARSDPEFPKRMKRHFKNSAPPLLYGAGDKQLLDAGGLAIIGSRDASEAALEFTRAIAAKCAKEGMAVVSGGARGVDAAAMQGVTEAGGHCIGVLASDLLKVSLNRQNRIGLQDGRLVLVTPFYPEAGFNAGNAMARNRYIYSLADQALVIDSALGSGGTWAGALEDLQHHWVPLFVRSPGEGPGNVELVRRGATAFSVQPEDATSLAEVFAVSEGSAALRVDEAPEQQQMTLAPAGTVQDDESQAPTVSDADATYRVEPPASEPSTQPDVPSGEPAHPPLAGSESDSSLAVPVAAPEVSTTDMYTDFVAKLPGLLGAKPLSEDEVAVSLGLEKSQAKAWLKRALDAGMVQKTKKPVRFALSRQVTLC